MEFSKQERDYLYKGLVMLRDRAYRNYYNAKNQESEAAQKQLAIYREVEDLRFKVRG